MEGHALVTMEALEAVMPYHMAFSPEFTRDVEARSQIELAQLFASDRLPEDGSFFDQRFVN